MAQPYPPYGYGAHGPPQYAHPGPGGYYAHDPYAGYGGYPPQQQQGYSINPYGYPGWRWDGRQWIPDPTTAAPAPSQAPAQATPQAAPGQPPLPKEPPPPTDVAPATSATPAAPAPVVYDLQQHSQYYQQPAASQQQAAAPQPPAQQYPYSYVSQQQQSAAAAAAAAAVQWGRPPPAAAAPAVAYAYSRMPPPASLSQPTAIKAGSSIKAKWGAIPSAAPSAATPAAPTAFTAVGMAGGPAAGDIAAAMAAARQKAAELSAAGGAGGGAGAAAAGAAAAAAPPAPSAAPAAPGAGGAVLPPNSYPPSLGAYISRCIADTQGAGEDVKVWVKERLKVIIKAYSNAEQLWSTNWDRWPTIKKGGFAGYAPQGGALPPVSPTADADRGRDAWAAAHHHQQQQQRGDADRDRDRWGQHAGGGGRSPGYGHRQWRRDAHMRDDGEDSGKSDNSEEGGGSPRWGGKHGGGAAGLRRGVAGLNVGGGRGGGKAHKQQQQQQRGKGKRKKAGAYDSDGEEAAPLWSRAEQNKRAKRGARFGEAAPVDGWAVAKQNWQAAEGARQAAGRGDGEDDEGWGRFTVRGTSSALEKSYYRLTAAPVPEEVRPPAVVASALARLVGMIAAGGPEGVRSHYKFYYCSQFKAMRQDLTVQGVKDEVAVQVYEAHARAALEYGDWPEYNQCQTQLKALYAAGLPGCRAEFVAYRLLYQMVHLGKERQKLQATMGLVLGGGEGLQGSAQVEHALQVREAVARGQWRRFWQLYEAAPARGLSRALMDLVARDLRFAALSTLVRSHRPNLPLLLLAGQLGFLLPPGSSTAAAEASTAGAGGIAPGCAQAVFAGRFRGVEDEGEALAACLEWVTSCKVVVDQKEDLAMSRVLTKDTKELTLPEDTTAVAHGDANIDINDFLNKP